MSTGDGQHELSALFIGQRGALVRMLGRVVGCTRAPSTWRSIIWAATRRDF
ncbi:hypothetical protein [Pseudomonas sp. Irchel 3E20]|uniref:hypothetical protein n=1 Tax=Pseudomonas sp. Irchel 3E20 TaxID=2008983 RepID=UPI0021141E45|nr:hypothetical protein [Pseudomonas sp. Irchel 3E20]